MDTNSFTQTCMDYLGQMEGERRPSDKFQRILIVKELYSFIFENLSFLLREFANKEKRDHFLSTLYSKTVELLDTVRNYECGSDRNKIDTCVNLENLMLEIANAIEDYFN
jgi:hypothetical protein